MLRTDKSIVLSLLVLFLFALSSCEQAEKLQNRTLVFQVQYSDTLGIGGPKEDGASYGISAHHDYFLAAPPEQEQDSIFQPSNLNVELTLLGRDLSSVLINPNGFRVKTQLDLNGGLIVISHTNQAMLVETEQGDTLYAVRGEGIVSQGNGSFENISGFFREESTYRLEALGFGQAMVKSINCRYELTIDF